MLLSLYHASCLIVVAGWLYLQYIGGTDILMHLMLNHNDIEEDSKLSKEQKFKAALLILQLVTIVLGPVTLLIFLYQYLNDEELK